MAVGQTVCVVIIFLISGLALKTDEVKQALRAVDASVFAITSVLLITPLLALAPQQLTFLPPEFRIGFLLFCTMPTTVNSGVALVSTARGNVALALLITVVSNVVGVFTVPFFLALLLSVDDVSIDPLPLLVKLLIMILLPLVVGKLLRDNSASLLGLYQRQKHVFSTVSNGMICLIVWMNLSVSGSALTDLRWDDLLGLLVCAIAIHLIFLLFNFVCARWILGLSLPMRKTVVILCSEKTLPMAMTVLAFFPESLGSPGLIAVPCIVSHLTQIFLDAFVAAKWAPRTESAPPAAIWTRLGCCKGCHSSNKLLGPSRRVKVDAYLNTSRSNLSLDGLELAHLDCGNSQQQC